MKTLSLFNDVPPAAPARVRRPAHTSRPARRCNPAERSGVTNYELKRHTAPAREGRTLEDVISGAWEDLTARRTTTCPICGGGLAPHPGSGPGVVAGSCRDCGTGLS